MIIIPKKAIKNVKLGDFNIPAGVHERPEVATNFHRHIFTWTSIACKGTLNTGQTQMNSILIDGRRTVLILERILHTASFLFHMDKGKLLLLQSNLVRRSCIGKRFAESEATVFLSMLAQNYKVERFEVVVDTA